MALDRAFQRASAIPDIGTLPQQKLPGAISDINQKRLAGGSGVDTLLHHLQLNINDPAQFLIAQRFEDYDFIQTVDEFRRERLTGCRNPSARYPGSEFFLKAGIFQRGNLEAQPRAD